jgi:hypothetical protein
LDEFFLSIDLLKDEFDRAGERWLSLPDEYRKYDKSKCDDIYVFDVFRPLNAQQWDIRLSFFTHYDEIQIFLQYAVSGKKDPSAIAFTWEDLELPKDPVQIWSVFFDSDKRRSKAMLRYKPWILNEFSNFISVFSLVFERSEIHEQIGYDS